MSFTGDIPATRLIAAAGEFRHGQPRHLLAADGLYRSSGGGKTPEKVPSETGSAAKSGAAKKSQ